MNLYRKSPQNDDEMGHLSDVELSGGEVELLERVRSAIDVMEEMPSEVRFFFDPQNTQLLSEVPTAMVKRVLILETLRDIKNNPDCDGLAVFLGNYYKIMRAYNRKGAREFLEMISIQSNEDEESIDDTQS